MWGPDRGPEQRLATQRPDYNIAQDPSPTTPGSGSTAATERRRRSGRRQLQATFLEGFVRRATKIPGRLQLGGRPQRRVQLPAQRHPQLGVLGGAAACHEARYPARARGHPETSLIRLVTDNLTNGDDQRGRRRWRRRTSAKPLTGVIDGCCRAGGESRISFSRNPREVDMRGLSNLFRAGEHRGPVSSAFLGYRSQRRRRGRRDSDGSLGGDGPRHPGHLHGRRPTRGLPARRFRCGRYGKQLGDRWQCNEYPRR